MKKLLQQLASSGYLRRLVPECTRHPCTISAQNTILLVIDMQEYLRSIARHIIPSMLRLVDTCREVGIPVIYTQHGHAADASDVGMLGQWWGDLVVRETPGWNFLKELQPKPEVKIIPKNRYSAFFGTDLIHHLKTLGTKNIIISGIMTNLCCETTARDAFVRDYRVFFLADCTSTNDPELHIATLRNLAFGFAHIRTCNEISKELM